MTIIKPAVSVASRRLVNSSIKRRTLELNRKKMYEKLSLTSYIGVCVDVGLINRAFNTLVRYASPKPNHIVDVKHYNLVIKGWARLNSIPQIVETRMHMIRNRIEPNPETYACILLAYSKGPEHQRRDNASKLLKDMRSRGIDSRRIFQSTYLSVSERKSIMELIQMVEPKFDDIFCQVPIKYNCKLLDNFDKLPSIPYDFSGLENAPDTESWLEHQRMVEWRSSISIKSIAKPVETTDTIEAYSKAWTRHCDMWRKSIQSAIETSLETLLGQSATEEKIHIYPYLCTVDKQLITNLLLDEVEMNAAHSSYSLSTQILHLQLGHKIMTRYLKSKAVAEGSHHEKQKIYNEYLMEYCRDPVMTSRMTSREFMQHKAADTKNYAIYKDRFSPVDQWPHHVISAVGRFLYGLLLREIKFDPAVVRNPKKSINPDKLVNAFYTAYFQVNSSHKIKEEFRAHQDFEKFQHKSNLLRLKFDYSFLPTSTPPLPWLSHNFGGYITNRSDLVRVGGSYAERQFVATMDLDNQKLYPSLDSLNTIGLCPWIVNKEILDTVIELFRSGGDADLSVPLDESRMRSGEPVLPDNPSKADRILYTKNKKKHEQKRREMYSLWRDCLYRLSIANHFRDRVFWFPHNMDFRGRTYPIPPHFNHLGNDLARSLLLFAKGRPLGEKGLDWLKIHAINLTGKMKSASLEERLDYANSILHTDILDSADNPWDGKRWWSQNEDPWQVLACCKEIAKAIRSGDARNYISHFPVHQDGSCNGLQHYAALGRDPSGALAVNLMSCDKPQDVYSRVVEIVERMRRDDAASGDKVAKMLEGFIQRKVIKQTVMTTVYGVTRYGARQQIARQLINKGYSEQEVWRAAQYLTAKTFESIGQMFNKSRLIQDWFNECAFVIASKYRQPVSWETPLGFPITQPYTVPSSTASNRLLSSSISNDAAFVDDPLSKLNAPKQKTAFPPNYIHSLDSSHMMLTSLHCQKQGITFVSVHDCYWTHPSTVDQMNKICREQFVALHTLPLLEDLSNQFTQKFGNYDPDSLVVKRKARKTAAQDSSSIVVADNESASVQTKLSAAAMGGRMQQVVEEDLHCLIGDEEMEKLIAVGYEPCGNLKESEDNSDMKSKPLIDIYQNTCQKSNERGRLTFKKVPATGELDLKNVLKSTYFFS